MLFCIVINIDMATWGKWESKCYRLIDSNGIVCQVDERSIVMGSLL